MLQETKIKTLPIYITEFRIYKIRGPPSEEKNPPAQDQPTGLQLGAKLKTNESREPVLLPT